MNNQAAAKTERPSRPRSTETMPAVKAVHRAKMTGTMRLKRMPGRARRGWLRVAEPAVVLLLLLAVERGGFGLLPLFNVRPQLLLVFACVAALHGGTGVGAAVGAAVGLLSDLGGGHLTGLSVFGYAAAASVAGSFSERLYVDRLVIVLTAVALGTVVEQLVYVAGAYAFGHPLPVLPHVVHMLPLLIVYHWLLTPLVYPLGRRLVQGLLARTTESA